MTSDRIADLILEYAAGLIRLRRTDVITIPATRRGHAIRASLLLGPASQVMTLTDEDDPAGPDDLPGDPESVQDIRERVERLRPRSTDLEYDDRFVDFDRYNV